MNTLPTAEEFFDSANIGVSNDTEYVYCQKDVVKKAKEFAKLHVEAALKEASKKIEYINIGEGRFIDLNSILYAYPLTNVK